MYLTLVKKKYDIVNNFSFLIFLVNKNMKPLRKIGVLFYSREFKRFVMHIDFFFLNVLFRDGVNMAAFFFKRLYFCVNTLNFFRIFFLSKDQKKMLKIKN